MEDFQFAIWEKASAGKVQFHRLVNTVVTQSVVIGQHKLFKVDLTRGNLTGVSFWIRCFSKNCKSRPMSLFIVGSLGWGWDELRTLDERSASRNFSLAPNCRIANAVPCHSLLLGYSTQTLCFFRSPIDIRMGPSGRRRKSLGSKLFLLKATKTGRVVECIKVDTSPWHHNYVHLDKTFRWSYCHYQGC